MNSTKPVVMVLISTASVLLFVSWQLENFGLLLLASALLTSVTLIFLKCYTKYLLPLIAALFTLAIFEFLIPFVSPLDEGKTYFAKDCDYNYRYFRRVDGFGYIPNSGVYNSRKLTQDGEEIYNVFYTIGKDGYRNTKIPGALNDYIFGGSCVFGEGLNDDETIDYYLWKDHSLSVKNAGMHGYGLHQALFNIENGFGANEGINILLTAPWHADRSSCKPDWSVGTPKYSVVDGYAQLTGICPGEENVFMAVLGKSNIFKIVRTLFTDKHKTLDEDIELYLAIIRSISKETRNNHSKLIVAFIKATDKQMRFTKYTNESLLKEIRKISDCTIDVTLATNRESLLPKYYIHELDQHPSALANRERAKLIADALSQLKHSP